MADVGIFTKNADIQARAGLGANATSKAVAATDVYVHDVEARICAATGYNWVDAYTANTLQEDAKYILKDIGACLCAIYVILYDFSGYPSRIDAEDKINVLYQMAMDGMEILKIKANADFVARA